jgi:hypothetical protein
MEKLVNILTMIDASDLPDSPEEEEFVLRQADHPQIYLAEAYATTLFVAEEGVPNFAEMDRLYQEYGYPIFPGERDRFGSVTGVILTKKGLIVFG